MDWRTNGQTTQQHNAMAAEARKWRLKWCVITADDGNFMTPSVKLMDTDTEFVSIFSLLDVGLNVDDAELMLFD